VKGTLLVSIDKKEEGIKSLKQIFTLEKNIPKHLSKWLVASCFELSEIYYKDSDFTQADYYMKKISNYNSNDWNFVFSSRIKFVQKEISLKIKK
jgi:hypothetical protein